MFSASALRVFAAVPMAAICLVLVGCWSSRTAALPVPNDIGPAAAIRVSLKADGLPDDFFRLGFDTKCSREIIGYRFVVWINNQRVAVGFNISPNCRLSPDRPVNGELRILVFDLNATVTADRTLPYLADGNGEVVADGEAAAGPDETLLVRFQSVNLDREGRQESASSVHLLDASLKDVVQLDRFLEQTTLVDHALVFQDGVVFSGPRNYSILSGPALKQVEHRQVDWPAGAMDRKFGAHEIAFIHCGQELKPGQYTATNVVHVGAKFRCSLNVLGDKENFWTRQLMDGETASLVGILSDGSVVGELRQNSGRTKNLVLWKKDRDPETLPWISSPFEGEIDSAARDFSRYALFATSDSKPCSPLSRVLDSPCDDMGEGRWFIFGRKSPLPIVNRAFPKNGRATLSPDGSHYASFEDGELRIYVLPK